MNALPTPSPVLPRTAMIGVGSMGGAILTGLRKPGVRIERPIAITTHSAASAAAFAGADDVSASAIASDPDANRRAVQGAKLVVLGVKPWMMADVVRDIADALEPGAIVVSLAAGVPSAAIEPLLPAGVEFVRAMPNTPSHLGLGVTGIAPGATASPAAVATVRALFETVGTVLVVGEDQINAITAVSGSGPAYVYLFAEQMMAAAARLGFDAEQSRALVEGTLRGSVALLLASDEGPEQLRRNVTSPKGTTEQAVKVLQGADWGELFDRAFAANIRRSEEIERGE